MQNLIVRLYVPICNITAAKINLFQFSLIILNCQQQMHIYWPYGLVDNYVQGRCHITSSLYMTDTSLR